MRMKPLFLGLAAAAAIVGGPAHAADAAGQANIQMVKQFLADVRVASAGPNSTANVRTVVERYMSPDYVQHAAGFPPGREGYIQVMSKGPPPGMQVGPSPGASPPAPKDLYFFADGDLRRYLNQGADDLSIPVASLMTRNPKVARPDMMAVKALEILEAFKIIELPVVDENHHPVGMIHLHDITRAGIVL